MGAGKAMKKVKTGGDANSTQKALADGIAKDLTDCDPSVLSVIVMGEVGQVLSVSRSSRLPESEHVDLELIPLFGVVAKTILGAANNAAQVMGETELIIGVFKRQKVLLMSLQEHNLSLALRLTRSANAEYVYSKIMAILKSS
jgi:hypothetical protein